jgi:hypothetical protein
MPPVKMTATTRVILWALRVYLLVLLGLIVVRFVFVK